MNNRETLAECLQRSPDVMSGALPVVVVENARSMAEAYNRGLERTSAPICIFAHQDVYLPRGWLQKLRHALGQLDALHPRWQVAGPYGVMADGTHCGRVWDVTLGRELGGPDVGIQPVGSLDELIIIVKRDPDFGFDNQLPDWHLYGTDIVQNALARGRSAHVIELPVVHNNRPIATLRGGYARAYAYARRKWAARLPIHTSICALTWNPFVLWRTQWRRRHVRERPPGLLADAVEVAVNAGYE